MEGIVGSGRAIIVLSSGIYSSTAAVLATKAIRRQLTAVFVDHGFMRDDEMDFAREVLERLI